MKIIVGLGNPGDEYAQTRHNAGFLVLDRLVSGKSFQASKSGLLEYAWLDSTVELVKPLTFMNRSGDAVGYVMKQHNELTVDDVCVIHDDLDIRLGDCKVQKGKGPRQHNGIASIERVLKSSDFWRVRVGVDNRDEITRGIPGKDYVLGRFSKTELHILEQVTEEVVGRLLGAWI